MKKNRTSTPLRRQNTYPMCKSVNSWQKFLPYNDEFHKICHTMTKRGSFQVHRSVIVDVAAVDRHERQTPSMSSNCHHMTSKNHHRMAKIMTLSWQKEFVSLCEWMSYSLLSNSHRWIDYLIVILQLRFCVHVNNL